MAHGLLGGAPSSCLCTLRGLKGHLISVSRKHKELKVPSSGACPNVHGEDFGRGGGARPNVFFKGAESNNNENVWRAEAQAYRAQLLALTSSLPASADVSSRLGEVRAVLAQMPS